MHGGAPDTVVAGYLFSEKGSMLFRKLYEQKIAPLIPADEHGRRFFHARKCVNGLDQFERLSAGEREQIVDSMVEAICASVMLGVVVGVENQEYAKAIAESPDLRQLAGDEYSVCLVRCIENLAGRLDHDKTPGKVHYIFEAGCKHQKAANRILRRLSGSTELKDRFRWRDYSFRGKDETVPQLFAADLLAWEWQRSRTNSLNQRKERRLTLKRLTEGASHIASYQTVTTIGIRALINSFYGLTSKKGPYSISI